MGNEVKLIKECEEGFEIILKTDSQKPIFAKNISVALGAVSYTHLDVYKRQT